MAVERPLRLFEEHVTEIEETRLQPSGTFAGVPAYELDVPETIPQLAYGTHQLFRYYGKFPSVVGGEIVRRHSRSGDVVLDCYAGSGTTLLEAQIEGRPALGLDINPLGVLASNVKTRYYDLGALRAKRRELERSLLSSVTFDHPPAVQKKLDKWFRPDAQMELSRLRSCLLQEPGGELRDFFLIAFLGIVRRVSNAYDGEVRPHFNPNKRPRSPFQAFLRKADEMIESFADLDRRRPRGIPVRSIVADNRSTDSYRSLCRFGMPKLIVAHPPYLNSFNYLQVFSLEFMWGDGFDELWGEADEAVMRDAEHRAWPATNPDLVAAYYEDMGRTFSRCKENLEPGGRLAVVIGDATIRGVLEAVHAKTWDMLLVTGFRPVEIWFRTTHYGIGKYAYRHRADYHGEAEKRDAILFVER